MAAPTPTPAPSDPTFRTYTPSLATAYLHTRNSYSTPLYRSILTHHLSPPAPPPSSAPIPAGNRHTLLDLGCGPGTSTRELALHFEHAIGADPGAAMIAAARAAGGRAGSGDAVRWVVGEAEGLEGVLERAGAEGWRMVGGRGEGGGVDMITAGMAAHWFDMRAFWAQADRVLNAAGTVALWTVASLYCHPAHPSAARIQAHLFHLELVVLAPYSLPPLDLSRNYYDALPLPWSCEPPVTAFPPSWFVRKTWDRDGVLSDGEDFFGGSEEISVDDLERQLGTASMVTRWRAAHSELVGTERDCVKECVERIRGVVGEGKFKVGGGTALLLFRKSV
ncbi:hypothetical protein MMC11_003534 [Xylographa trunciseda]|nr:hypothetical protein [Xylographa trunciseda]